MARIRRYLSVPIFTLALFVSFGFCSWAGLVCSHRPLIDQFHRFFLLISPTTGFAITSGELMALLPAASAANEKVTVVVGGNSVFNCAAIAVEKNWTERLQKKLGEKFVVVNFALEGALPFEGGYMAAESLFKQGRKVIYLTDTVPGECGNSFGYVFSSIFFDFRSRGLLLEDEGRDQWLMNCLKEERRFFGHTMAEQERWAWLDRYVNAVDLWQNIGYNHFFTIWSHYTNPQFWKPRRQFKDQSFPRPWPSEDLIKSELESVRERCGLMQWDGTAFVPVQLRWCQFDTLAARVVPRPMRDHVILSLVRYNPLLLQKLSKSERNCDAALHEEAAGRWRDNGIETVVLGGDYKASDYIDANHFSLAGTDKLVEEMARLVQMRAEKLGYLP